MRLLAEKKVLRVLDANFNRAKEGLRVCEDITRFVLDDPYLARQYKTLRHALSGVGSLAFKHCLVAVRDSRHDVGRTITTKPELTRKTVKDIFWANSQRVKESVRVLEEFLKLADRKSSASCKEIRYRIYVLEQKILGRIL